MPNLPEEQFIELIASDVELRDAVPAPTRLKAKLYSAMMLEEAAAGPLMSVSECANHGGKLCVFERLVQIAPVGRQIEALNYCRVCHARILAEKLENPPIYWHGCPYVQFKKS